MWVHVGECVFAAPKAKEACAPPRANQHPHPAALSSAATASCQPCCSQPYTPLPRFLCWLVKHKPNPLAPIQAHFSRTPLGGDLALDAREVVRDSVRLLQVSKGASKFMGRWRGEPVFVLVPAYPRIPV